ALRYPEVTGTILEWLCAADAEVHVADFALDGLETLLAALPAETIRVIPRRSSQWGFRDLISSYDTLSDFLPRLATHRKQWSDDHACRMFRLRRWIDEPLGAHSKSVPREHVDWPDVVAAFTAGAANEHDVYDALLGPRAGSESSPQGYFDEIRRGSEQLRRGELSAPLARLVQRAIDRVLEIELERGEPETPATTAARSLDHAGGTDVLLRILRALGPARRMQRNSASWGDTSRGKAAVFSYLIRVTLPGKADSLNAFADAVRTAGIDEDRLLAVAFSAPQWARNIEAALGWVSFADAVWWFHAHTKDSQWRIDEDLRAAWNAEIRQRTPLTLEDLQQGAVDVAWFQRVHADLGPRRWARLDAFAKYACGGAGHKRAQLFAAAMLNKVSRRSLIQDIESKRKQDAVRALGLLPLGKNTTQDVLERYLVMQELVRTCRQFGGQRQASEKLAARIGQENLARTAGYPDPIRLQWAMEALSSADLADGPVAVTVDDVVVELSISSEGRPEITQRRGNRTLKAVPPKVKKAEAVRALIERKTDLRRSASRMRQSLEMAMCRGDAFTRDEVLELLRNVLLQPLLERLVFIGEGVLGYPVDGGKGLRDHHGKIEPVKKNERLRLAHPVDLLAGKAWHAWQRECFAAERVQPFKQVFRELYVLTKQERSDRTFSRRYAGQQVNPRQAVALFTARGWVAAPEVGVFRTFHDEKLTAWIEFQEPFYTPAEIEGLTLEKIHFAQRGEDKSINLSEVPPRLLSEVLRDVDLVVSVAHRGGVDPEASASTVEMRAALLRETAALLRLEQVSIKPPHAFIRGERAEYSVHLGSATTHMLPGGALFIVPVHSQHRGRMFLPFADDDPKTAEVISKVLLLARDTEIQDPALLEQIRGCG
ncbi:MAG TPA: DUF5724 domain-containing protein, partial [Phycisphaerae bacterium]|nr:DUF5724 domain-containing protein [Phycisphaerae bacterium]